MLFGKAHLNPTPSVKTEYTVEGSTLLLLKSEASEQLRILLECMQKQSKRAGMKSMGVELDDEW